jgi:hypothetical protein
MARYTGKSILNQVYNINEYHPLDTRMLVPTYSDLTLESNWLIKGESNAFNGMIVAVGSNIVDTSKNGVYYLFDIKNPGADDIPDVTKEENWHKLVSLKDIAGVSELIEANANKLQGIETTVVDLINERLSEFANIDLSEYAKISDVETYVNTLINAADPEGGKTIASIQNLVNYVDENADEIARLITKVDVTAREVIKHTNDIVDLTNKIAAINQPKESDEISVSNDGTLNIKELNVNKLTQTFGDTLILSGGSATV